VETLEDRLTPSVSLVKPGAILPVLFPVAATGTGTMRALDTSALVVGKLSYASPDFNTGWSNTTIPGVIKAEALAGAVLDLVGYGPDPASSDTDLYITQVSTIDGSIIQSFYVNMPGSDFKGLGADVDASGVIYAVGTISGTGGFAARFDPVAGQLTWVYTSPTAINLKGVKLDAAGTNLYATGADSSGMNGIDLLVVKLTNLASSAPTQVYYDVRSSLAGLPSQGNAITVDSNGRADTANTVLGPQSPGVIQIEPDGSNKPGWYFPGDTGEMKAVALGPDGTWIAVGNGGDGTAMITVKLINNLNGDNGDFVWGGGFDITMNKPIDVNAVVIDSTGNYTVAGFMDNGAPTGKDVMVAKFNGNTGTDQLDILTKDFGADDIAYAMVMDGAGNLYVAGTTGSNGLVFQVTP
jgi:hypothetical protein